MKPTNGELKIMFDNLSEKQDTNHHEVIDLLHEVRDDVKETKETAQQHESRLSRLEFWKAAIIWAVGTIIGILGAMFPILKSIVTHEIQRSVRTALIDYDKIIIDNK